jgi:hypothetical protein
VITIALGDLAAAERVLAQLAAVPLPVKTAYQVARLLRIVQAETKQFHAQRETWIRELGEEREATETERAAGVDVKVVAVRPENVETYAERMRGLAEVEIELAAIPITLEGLGSIAMAATDIAALGRLLTE